MPADELVDQLHEGSAVYAGRSAAAAGRLRASVLAEFGEVGLPAAAVPYVVEVLRTELNPEVVAAAAVAVRGWPGSDPALASALVQAVVNLRGRDGPAGPGTSRTALVEVLAALATGEVLVEDHVRRLTAPVSGGGKVLVEALGRLDAAGIEVLDVGLRRPTLDDVFLTLTGHAAEQTAEQGAA